MKKFILFYLLTASMIIIFSCQSDPGNPPGPSATGNPPDTPYSPTPRDSLVGVSRDQNLFWVCNDSDFADTLSFDVYFGKNYPTSQQVATNLRLRTYDPGYLDSLSTYYWRISARDLHNNSTISPIWRFTTGQF